ncbi:MULTISPECIES: DUF2165 family protein [Cyanophyceae]|uniref:DUF2165 domain-containing protein n=1 Tax=Leptolyngbya subtilissima DQ-A4 TaxID=2933933 RepID=A0ABV0KB88_9CYAN|nr:DUF2165 family protein [Nodosilinea sp. FACHB-141]
MALLFWFIGFINIVGEWLAAWQFETWNGQQPAFRFIGCDGVVLLFLNIPEFDTHS